LRVNEIKKSPQDVEGTKLWVACQDKSDLSTGILDSTSLPGYECPSTENLSKPSEHHMPTWNHYKK
jgi:hypothetical protein